MEDDAVVLIESSLCGHFDIDNRSVEVAIYRLADTNWTLEVVDESGTSTVWEREFETDTAAMEEFVRSVQEEGIERLLAAEPDDAA